MSKKKTHEEYVAQVAEINPSIEVVGEYIDAKTKILHRCKIDGYEWSPSPSSVISGRGCPECRNRILSEKMSLSHDEYVNRVKNINPNIEVISQYTNSENRVKFHCMVDDYVWSALPYSILRGSGCPRCSSRERYTAVDFIKKANKLNKKIKVIGEYINKDTKIKCTCQNEHEFEMLPGNILKGQGCSICSGIATRTQEEYIREVSEINKDIEVLETYINASTPIAHMCKKCYTIWRPRPNHVLEGHGCPVCNSSIGERIVKNYLDSNCINYIQQYKFQDCKDIHRLPFDFYLSDYNILVEYDGIQHFQPVEMFGGVEEFEITKKHDNIKNNYCILNNIPLLRILYDEDVKLKLDEFLASFITIQN